MERSRTDQILEDWDMASSNARRPSSSPRPSYLRGMGPLAAAAAVAVIALAAGALWFSRPGGPGGFGGGSTPTASPLTTPLPAVTPSIQPSPTVPAAPSASPTAGPTASLGAFSCSFPITLAGTASGASQAQPTDVRVGTHAGYDRIVFEYSGTVTPSLTVTSVSPPFTRDPSGLPMTVAGSSFLQIKLEGVTQSYTGTTDFKVSYPVLVELARQGDFEGIQTWIAGLRKSTCLRVFQLSAPTRLVIDLQQ